jgi:dTDP-4-amino-4,6-dideoxygalactose transaminase
MTTGEGGMIVTDDSTIADRLRMIRNHGQVEGYDTSILGGNLRMPELEAAIGTVQLSRLPQFLTARRKNAESLTERLRGVDDLVLPKEPRGFRHNWYLYTVRFTSKKRPRDEIVKRLNRMKIGATVYYPTPIHQLPLYRGLGYADERFPVAEQAAQEVFSLPVNPMVTRQEVEYITSCVKKVLGGSSER